MSQKPPTNSGAQISVKYFAAVTAVIFAAAFSLVLWWWLTPPKFVVEADAGFKRARQTIDPEQLRAWALEMIQKKASGKEAPISMPGYIHHLYSEPPEILVDDSCVNLMWGGGFFHWGFHIGNTNETLPFISDNTEYPYNFEWKPGIYYTREGKWKLQ
jgi:hypothetical protein